MKGHDENIIVGVDDVFLIDAPHRRALPFFLTCSLSSSSAATTASARLMSKSSTLVETASSKSACEARGFGGGMVFFVFAKFKLRKMNELERVKK